MSAERNPDVNPTLSEPRHGEDWVRVPAVIDPDGDRVVTLYDEKGKPRTRLVAEVVLESFSGFRPSGYVIRFKDSDRLNCSLENLEWVPGPDLAQSDEPRARAIATRQRADATRQSLEGSPHSDSAELLAEDRLSGREPVAVFDLRGRSGREPL